MVTHFMILFITNLFTQTYLSSDLNILSNSSAEIKCIFNPKWSCSRKVPTKASLNVHFNNIFNSNVHSFFQIQLYTSVTYFCKETRKFER